jgi:uncharacterized membrane protein YtjA (UPF0391 family)
MFIMSQIGQMAVVACPLQTEFNRKILMLQYAITFFIIALLAGLFGFWGVAGLATEIAKILCIVFIILMIVSLFRGRTPRI